MAKFLDRLNNTKTRTLVLFGGVILIVVILVIVFVTRKSNPLGTEESRAPKIPQITAIPGNVTSQKYQGLQEEENRRRAEQAKKTGGSAVATIIGARSKDAFSKKETFGIEDQLLKGGECKCPPTSKTLPGCPENPELAIQTVDNNKAAAKELLTKCPSIAKLFAQKNPALLKQLLLENPDLAKTIDPEILKNLMKNDPDFADQFAKKYPDIVKDLMRNDAAFAAIMAKQNPDMVKRLMADDPEFARFLKRRQPGFLAEQQRVDEAARTRRMQLTEQQQKQIAAIITNMEAQSKAAFQSWNEISTQQFVQGDQAKKDQGGNGASGTGGGGANGSNGAAGAGSNVILKAGTVLFGVLDTAINSDEPSPVLATIVQGKYKGARLLGTLRMAQLPGGASGGRPEKVIVNFTRLNAPNSDKTIAIDAVAIDPDTARSALATDTDHHYLLRYGTLFASSLLTGYAKVLTSQGTVQTTNSATGSTTTTSPQLNSRQQLFAALGELGQKWGDATASYFNLPNTITVDPGTGIGILIMSDVTSNQ